MGVDYRNIIMYGKEFDSFMCAMDHLINTNKITDKEYEEALEDGEVANCEWNVYNAYSGGAGVLGESFSAKTLYTNPEDIKVISKGIDELIGKGCKIHEFVKVY